MNFTERRAAEIAFDRAIHMGYCVPTAHNLARQAERNLRYYGTPIEAAKHTVREPRQSATTGGLRA